MGGVKLPPISEDERPTYPLGYSAANEVYEMKLRKKLLNQQMNLVNHRMERMSKILEKKDCLRTGRPYEDKDAKKEVKKPKTFRDQRIYGTKKFELANKIAPEKNEVLLGVPSLMKTSILKRRQQQLIDEAEKTIVANFIAKENQKKERKKWLEEKRKKDQMMRKKKLVDLDGTDDGGPTMKRPVVVPRSFFPSRYDRGELPCTIRFSSSGKALRWSGPIEALDLEYYIPIFVDGIRVTSDPCKFMARQGSKELIDATIGKPDLLLPVMQDICKGLRWAMSTQVDDNLRAALSLLRQMLKLHPVVVGKALIPFYKIFLPVLNLNIERFSDIGDSIDYKERDIGPMVCEVLEMLETTGGENAYAQIKFSVPLYEHFKGEDF